MPTRQYKNTISNSQDSTSLLSLAVSPQSVDPEYCNIAEAQGKELRVFMINYKIL